jgi:hypothetical protein
MSNRLYSFRVNTESDADMIEWLESRKNVSAWIKKAIYSFMHRRHYIYNVKVTFWGTWKDESISMHANTDWPSIGGLTTNELVRIARTLFEQVADMDSRFLDADGIVCQISLSQSLEVTGKDWDKGKFGYVEPMSVNINL